MIIKKIAVLALIGAIFSIPAFSNPTALMLEDLTPEQVTKIKQLGRESEDNNVDAIYDEEIDQILTPEQRIELRNLKSKQSDKLPDDKDIWLDDPAKAGD